MQIKEDSLRKSEGASTSCYCSVCSDHADGHHFGAATCRACAAFFRRSVQLSKKHSCSKSKHCIIDSTVRNMCRLCRFNKCLQVGMKKSAVQRKRDMIGRRDVGMNGIRGKAVLDQLFVAYHNLLESRKKVHGRSENQSARPICFTDMKIAYANEMTVSYTFLCQSFPEYSASSPDVKRSLFKNFFLPFMLLESSYLCYINDTPNVMYIPSGDYIDLQNIDSYFNEDENYIRYSKQETISMFSKQFSQLNTCITKPFVMENVEKCEFLALGALILWEIDVESDNDRYAEAQMIRNDIIRDLLYYYKVSGSYDDPALRLGKILTIIPSIQRVAHRFRDYMELKNVLNLYAMPSHLLEMFTSTD